MRNFMKPNIFLIYLFLVSSCGKGQDEIGRNNFNSTYYNSETFQAEDLRYDFKIPAAQKHYEEGRRFYEEKEFTKAIESYKSSLQIEKKSGTYNELGMTYRTIKDSVNSINTFKEGIRSSANSWSLYFNLANTYAAVGDYENAKKYFEQIITKTDQKFWKEYSYLNLSAIYYNERDIDKAKEFLEKSKNIQNNEKFEKLYNSIKQKVESY